MAELIVESPFGPEEIHEVPLERAPLAKTLAQIRFANQGILTVSEEPAHRLAAAVSDQYPTFNTVNEVSILLGPDGVTQTQTGAKVWQLITSDEQWQVTFSRGFLSLETSTYTSREDFCSRLGEVWKHFQVSISAPLPQRIGFRYINRLTEQEHLDRLEELVRPAVFGAHVLSGKGAEIVSSLALTQFAINATDGLQARSGILEASSAIDVALPPVERPSWILDIDSWRTYTPANAHGIDVRQTTYEIGEVGYRYFRWAVTPEFLRTFGGKV